MGNSITGIVTLNIILSVHEASLSSNLSLLSPENKNQFEIIKSNKGWCCQHKRNKTGLKIISKTLNYCNIYSIEQKNKQIK